MKKCCRNARFTVLSPYKEEYLCPKCFEKIVREVQLEKSRQETQNKKTPSAQVATNEKPKKRAPAPENDIVDTIKEAGIEFVDHRNKGGALWIVGGEELTQFVEERSKVGISFSFKAGGGKSTDGKDAWWVK